jgi:meiosis-specific transcription factor NDT80
MSNSDSLRKTSTKDEYGTWLGGGASVGREQRFNNSLYPKCGRFEPAETSRGYYPDLSAL